MGRFVERPGEVAMRPPLAHLGTVMRCFWLRAHRERLKDLCNLAFDVPTRGALRVEPATDGVALVWAEIPEIRSLHPLDAKRGYASEVDVSFWIPVHVPGAGDRISWYIPWLFVDSDWALILGREMYGFPKALGRFSAPPLGRSGTYRVEAMVLDRDGPDAAARVRTVLEIKPLPSRRSRVKDVAKLAAFSGLWQPAQWIAQARTWSKGERPSADMVFLRQLRSAADPEEAAHQEVLSTPAEVLAVRGGGILSEACEVVLPRSASLPIADALGLRSDGHPVEAAFHVTVDFVVGAGTTLWRAGPAPATERPSTLALRKVELFARFDAAELEVVADAMRLTRATAGQVLVREGDPGGHDGMYALLEGEVVLSRTNPVGGTFERALRPGEAFGLVALVDRAPRAATCRAATPCVLATLDRAGFEALRRSPNREVANKMLWMVAQQLARDVQAVVGQLRDGLQGS